ncbi:YiiX/YebB-like N1pC/P60 family cysteine hydrolase [Motiliproteus sp. SC1-56]|uniref:YiiX/YebB-like N1pC/P60 family cysteine hydrolase n=1 Tax=Motiliproteus sp. SC1-56 TaxID=2799565 RepID=UPI001A8DA956|nr:YiiX/YebB-like N1pC/P60 family cysteine hydrolase [Motiliproteus sp. SC1-56]
MAKYETIRSKLKTGDIVLFSGKGAISHGIKLFTLSKWSHVGMVIKLPDTDTVFIWESTTLSNLADVIDGKKKKGVQLILLSDRIRTYSGEVSIRHLQGYVVDEKNYEKLMALRASLRNKPYEKNEIELIKSAYDGPWGHNEEDLSSLFCSELVAEAYQCLGLISSKLSSNEFTPKDFTEEKKLELAQGASLSKEIAVTI